MKVMTKPKVPYEIHERALNGVISLSNTSEILKTLMEKGLVVCVNSRERIGKLYILTKTGKVVRNKMYGSGSSYGDIPNEIIKDYT